MNRTISIPFSKRGTGRNAYRMTIVVVDFDVTSEMFMTARVW